MSHTGTIVEARKDVFAPDVVVRDPQTGESVRVPGRLVEAGTDYIMLVFDDTLNTLTGIKSSTFLVQIQADLKDVQIPRDQQVVGLAVKFDVVGNHERGDRVRAVNVVRN